MFFFSEQTDGNVETVTPDHTGNGY